jgi:hypothetical protein
VIRCPLGLPSAAVLLCATLLGACGGTARHGSGQPATPSRSRRALSVSTSPIAREIDAQCAQVMPPITAALQMAQKVASGSEKSFDTALLSQAAADARALDAATVPTLTQDASNGQLFRPASWHEEFDGFAGTMSEIAQALSTPGVNIPEQGPASTLVQEAKPINGLATEDKMPHCRPDPGLTAPSTTNPGGTASTTLPAPATTPQVPATPTPCTSASHNLAFRCATPAHPYCEQGHCMYRAPPSGPCAPGYRRQVTSIAVCEKPL